VHLRVDRSDAELLEGLKRDQPWAKELLFERYAPLIERTLRRILGHERHSEMGDLIHDSFVQALSSAKQVREAEALPGWVRSVAVFTACKWMRQRTRRRWLTFWEPEKIEQVDFGAADPVHREACKRTYGVLERMPADERAAFALRHIEALTMPEVATACGVSLSTIQRRLGRAEERFVRAARNDEILRGWLEHGGRWEP
jgi:RNA polymerase sigma-70 factor (ECF subfamily)